jgi:hypothetical protein
MNAAYQYDDFLASGGPEPNDAITAEDLIHALAIAVAALRQYRDGKTWRHIATDALEELERRGLVEAEAI